MSPSEKPASRKMSRLCCPCSGGVPQGIPRGRSGVFTWGKGRTIG